MPLPKEIDEIIRSRMDELIQDGKELLDGSKHEETSAGRVRITHINYEAFSALSSSALTLIRRIAGEQMFLQRSREFEEMEKAAFNTPSRRVFDPTQIHVATSKIIGVLTSLKRDYELGMHDNVFHMIEATVSYDFMGQAEQLLDGEKPDYDHVPAAVLAGAVLENGLRRLCQRQSPPIETKWDNGKPKRLNALIDELQGKAFKPAKADQLRSWTKTRNSAGHGEVEDFTRADVEDMIAGIKRFLEECDL